MKWRGRRQSSNVEYRRGSGGRRMAAGGGGIGIGAIVLVLIGMYFGIDPQTLLQMTGGSGGGSYQPSAGEVEYRAANEQEQFAATVLADTEDVWNKIFRQAGRDYPQPKMVVYQQATPTACGTGQAAMGPFYCPADQQVYIDLTFFDELARKFGAPGDFAQAYVIAHEVGHHIQTITGTSQKVRQAQRSMSTAQRNAMSVRQELQADCFAGLWAHHADKAKQILERGDLREALRAATAIGDDTLQRRSAGRVVPDSFTHGSADQRVRWFTAGFESGRFQDCDTFTIPERQL